MSSQDSTTRNLDPQTASTQAEAYHFPLGVFLILGSLAGLIIVLAFMNGMFEEWHPLNPPPSMPLEFAGIDVYFYQADPYVIGQHRNTCMCDVLAENVEQQPVCAWRWEAVGGVMVLFACLIALPPILQSANLLILLITSLPYLPGLMFLLAGLLYRREQRLKSS